MTKSVQPHVKAEVQIGDKMKDGTIFAGISPDTNKPIYALPTDVPLTLQWEQAMKYAADFKRYGHSGENFRVPTANELNVLLENRAQIGGFDQTGYGSYWASNEHCGDTSYAWTQSFEDGERFSEPDRGWFNKKSTSSLRLVCG